MRSNLYLRVKGEISSSEYVRRLRTRGRRRSKPRLGAGDSAYIIAWCAWREAERQADCLGDFDENDARQRFSQWWNEVGNDQLARYGYRLLDTAGDGSTFGDVS